MDKIECGNTITKNSNYRTFFDNRYTPRSVQEDALEFCYQHRMECEECGEKESAESKEKGREIIALSGPCGVGKSHIAMAVCEYYKSFGLSTAYITPQKSLQLQLNREFPEINCFMGRENYPCLLYPGVEDFTALTAESLSLCKHCKREECEYKVRKKRCYSENITVFNPLSYLYLTKETDTSVMYEASTIIIDEAQSVVSMLCNVFDFKLWKHEFKYPKDISASMPALTAMLNKYQQQLMRLKMANFEVKERIRIARTIQRLGLVINGLQSTPDVFVAEEARESYRGVMSDCLRVRVTAPPRWLLSWFFGEAKNLIIMSGTLFKSDLYDLGFRDYSYVDLPSPIHPDRRRFIPLGAVNNNFNNTSVIAQLGEAILKLAERHPNERGLVLATYSQAKGLSEYLRDQERFIFHDKDSKKQTIDKFMSGEGENTIAVLSGSWEGLDAKDDLARFVIITKCPYPNMSDKVVLRKMDQDPNWYGMEAMKFIIQGANRASRNEQDFSVTYMLDSNFTRLYAQTKSQLPKYFIESVKWGEKL